jgi:Uma2 family endonuclease
MDKAAFLAWVQAREGRYELAQGRVIMMPGASRGHGIIVMNLAALMRAQLDAAHWTVISEFGLDAGPETLRYPDIVVDRAGGSLRDHTATAPVLLAEVLSPSSEATDLGDKAAEYLLLPSLRSYLVFSQDEYKVWIWSRGKDAFPPAPTPITGLDKVIKVAALNLVMPMGAIYAGVDLG